MCLNETHSKVRIGKYLSHTFPIQNDLKYGDTLSPLIFIFALEYDIWKLQESQVGLKLNGTRQLLVYADDVNLLGDNIDIRKKNTQTLIDASKEVGLEVNTEKIKYTITCMPIAKQRVVHELPRRQTRDTQSNARLLNNRGGCGFRVVRSAQQWKQRSLCSPLTGNISVNTIRARNNRASWRRSGDVTEQQQVAVT
jgi:hypothetical protein